MTRLSLYFGFFLIVLMSCTKEEEIDELPVAYGELPCSFVNFRYYHDEPVQLGEMSGDYIMIGSDSTNSDNAISDFIKTKDFFDQNYNFKINKNNNDRYKYIGLKLSKYCSCEEISWIINETKQNPIIDYAHFTVQTDYCKNLLWETIGDLCVICYGSIFYVMVKDINDLSDLNSTILETKTMIRGQIPNMNYWYSIYADKNSKGNALEMANYFHETGLFEVTDVSMFRLVVE